MGSAILPGILDIGGSVASGMSASSAAGDQLAATQAGIAEKQREFNVTQQNMAPWLQTGQNALAKLSYMLGLPSSPSAGDTALMNSYQQELNSLTQPRSTGGITPDGRGAPTGRLVGGYLVGGYPVVSPETSGAPSPGNQARIDYLRNQIDQMRQKTGAPTVQGSDFGYLLHPYGAMDLQNDPGYQFRLDQGVKTLDHSAAARGDLFSGAQQKALTRYGQDYASNEYQNAYNRDTTTKNRIYNYLSGTAGTGASTAANLGTLGASNSSAIADLLAQGGNAQAAGTAALGSSIASGLSNTANYLRLQSLLRS